MSNGQQPPTEPQPTGTKPVYTFGPNVQLRQIKGFRLPGEGQPASEDSARLQLALTSGKILTGIDALRARGVRGRAASSQGGTVFYGEGLVDQNGYLARDFYNVEDNVDAATVLANMKPSERQQWAAEAKRVGLYVNTEPSSVILARGESYNTTDENAMRLFLQEANFNQVTAKAMLQKMSNYASVDTGDKRVAPMVSSPEDIGYYLNQTALSMTGKPMTKALAKQLIEQYQQLERQAATSRVSAPSKAVFAQSAISKQQPDQVAGNAVGKAIQLAFQTLAGR